MTLITAEEFCDMAFDDDERYELVRGVVHQVRDSPRPRHGFTAAEITYAIRHYLETHPVGALFAQLDVITERGPDTIRIPDIAFISNEGLKDVNGWKPSEVPPDLAIEILSPSNPASEIEQKVDEYLARGSRLVWIADPKTRTVVVRAPNALAHVVRSGEFLDVGDVLPEFRVEVNKLFGYFP